MILPDRANIHWQGKTARQAYHLGRPLYFNSPPPPGPTPPPPDPGDGDFAQLPVATGTTTTSDANFVSDANTVAAGRHILLPPGNYAGRTINFTNGTAAQPIIVRPQDPANPPVLTGTWLLNGRVQFWGVRFDNSAGSAVGSRLVRFQSVGHGAGLYYCDIIPGGIGVELRGGSGSSNVVVYRSFFNGVNQVGVSGGNGYEAIKAGTNATFKTDLSFQCILSKFRNFNKEREAIKMSSANSLFFRCHGVNNTDTSFRACVKCTVEECDFGSSRITVWGHEHRIDNCKSGEIRIFRGTEDSDIATSVGGGIYLSSKRTIVRNTTAPSIIVGYRNSWNSWPVPAVDTGLRNNSVSPTIIEGSSLVSVASYPEATPRTLNDNDVGVAGYQSRVTLP